VSRSEANGIGGKAANVAFAGLPDPRPVKGPEQITP
jgi:hypothetical protein